MSTSLIRFPGLCSPILCVVLWLGQAPPTVPETNCLAQETVAQEAHPEVARAVNVIQSGKEGVSQGFQILRATDLRNTACPGELLALVHTKGEAAGETIWRLGMLIADRNLSISGKRLAAEYDKAGKTGRLARRTICALAAYQTGRTPPRGHSLGFGGPTPKSDEPKALDEETLALLARALRDDDPAVRIAAADSIRLGAIRDDRFRDPLLKAIEDENCAVSDAAALAAADLGYEKAGSLILRQLESELKAPWEDRRDDMAACGFPLAPIDAMHLWEDYFSPQYGRGRLVIALKTLRYRPALPLLREMAAPHNRTEEEMEYLTGGENVSGDAEDLAAAILVIEYRPDRLAALLQVAKDATLAGDVRATALRMFDDRGTVRKPFDDREFIPPASQSGTDKPLVTEIDKQSREPEIVKRVLKLIDDPSPITDHYRAPSRLGRLAIQVAAYRFDTRSAFYQARLHAARKAKPILAVNSRRRPPDPAIAYPEELLPLRQRFQEKMVSLFSGEDAALALEALVVACPEWGTTQKYIDIATDAKRPPLLRVAAANLLTWQPFFLEMEGGGIDFGENAPPQTASKLLSLLETRRELEDWSHQEALTSVFLDLLGYPDSDLSNKQKAARKKLLPKLQTMRDGPHADAALDVLLKVYGFSRPSTAWDPAVGDPADKPKWPDDTGAGAREGPPVRVTTQRSFGFRYGVRLCDIVQDGESVLVGDGSTLSPSGSFVILLDPKDLSDKSKASITEELPWSSSSAALTPDQQHAVVFNRYLELKSFKTTSVLDVKKAVAKGNVQPMPLAISPDGKLALIHVGSYLSSRLDALALFDLKTGGLEQVIDVGEARPFCNACFLGDKEIAVLSNRGFVLAVNIENGAQRDLCDDGPQAFSQPGMNWRMFVLAEGRYLVVCGHEGFVVVDASQSKEVFRKKVGDGNAIPVQGGRFLLYQAPSQGSGRPLHFFCVRVSDGKAVCKFPRQQSYETLMSGKDDGVVYAVSHATLSRLVFRWPDEP